MELARLGRGDFEMVTRRTGQRGLHCLVEDEGCGSACLSIWTEGAGTPFAEDHAVVYDSDDPITMALVVAALRAG